MVITNGDELVEELIRVIWRSCSAPLTSRAHHDSHITFYYKSMCEIHFNQKSDGFKRTATMKSMCAILCLVIFATCVSCAQNADSLLGDGLSVQGGLGHLAIRDEYISEEVYSGTLPYFEMIWLRSRDSSAYRLGLEYREANAIRNNNISAGVTQSALDLDYLYYAGSFSFRGKHAFAYVGPSTELYVYFRNQNIANGGAAFFNAYSFAMFYSLGINSTIILPLRSGYSVEWSGRVNLVSGGMRLIDMQNNESRDEKMSKFSTIFTGIRGKSDLLVRVDLTDALMLKIGYRFEICQSSSWNYLLAASDNVILVMTYHL